jgi:type VI secretion system protein ImpH
MPRLGKAQRPRDEPLRVGQDVELDFAPSAISSWQASSTGSHGAPRLGQRVLGLFGPMGPMPLHLTEFTRERERHHGDRGPAGFADVFHHRSTLLFYRAWSQSQPTTHLDRSGDDAYSRWLSSLFGQAQPQSEQPRHLPPQARRHRAALLARSVRSAEGLVKLLQGWFGVTVQLEPYAGHWLRTEVQERTRLTHPRDPQACNRLGLNAVVGSRVWDRQHKFRLVLGPLSLRDYLRFLPGQAATAELDEWVRLALGQGLDYEVQLVLRAGEVPTARPGSGGDCRPRLGLTSWLASRGGHAERRDLRLSARRLQRSNPPQGLRHG